MKLSVEAFRDWEHKSITLLGMSGVGKTRLAVMLRKHNWFHYSGDYRIGTRYLDEPILDNIKQQAIQIPFLRDLLLNDSIYIGNNITVNNLQPVSSFLGKLGNPEHDGLPLDEFKRRQALHHDAEVSAMLDVPSFIAKAHSIYGYKHFINDAGGSVCELDDPHVLETLAQHTLIIYIKATPQNENELIQRAKTHPKPLYYREDFLDQHLQLYMTEKNISYVALIEPDDFVRWVFSYLFKARIPRYDKLAAQYGYTVSADDIWQVQSEDDFLQLIETTLANT